MTMLALSYVVVLLAALGTQSRVYCVPEREVPVTHSTLLVLTWCMAAGGDLHPHGNTTINGSRYNNLRTTVIASAAGRD